jgi:branched-chain amino acid transport system substrate-binding protein
MAGPWIAQRFAGKNIAVVHDKSTYGKGLADLAKAAMNKAGLKEVAYEAVTAGEKDYTALVTKLKEARVDAVYFGGYHPEASLIVKQMREQGLGAQLLSGDSLNTLEFAQLAGKEAAAGTMFTDASNASKLPSAQSVVATFKAGGYEPEGYTLSSYAAVQAWAQAATKAGTTEAAKVATTLRSQDWDTVIGTIGFDAKGDLKQAAYVWYVFDKDGRFGELQTN